MPRAKKTAAEKMQARPPHMVVLDADFAGVPKGSRLLISSPIQLGEYIKSIPPGRSLSLQQLRREMAKQQGADATCPVSTSIFLRILTEYTYEQAQSGTPDAALTPVWRVLEPDIPLRKKLSIDLAWVDQHRAREGLPTALPQRATAKRASTKAA